MGEKKRHVSRRPYLETEAFEIAAPLVQIGNGKQEIILKVLGDLAHAVDVIVGVLQVAGAEIRVEENGQRLEIRTRVPVAAQEGS